jgi:mono/diheme cytochrome c family protein
VLPGLAGGFLFALPFLDNKPDQSLWQRIKWLTPILAGAAGIGFLTVLARHDDGKDKHYQQASAVARARAERSVLLAGQGIPPGGPLEMLAKDPLSRGPIVYADACSTCHVLGGEGEYAAPVHTGLGSREWLDGMLHDPQDARYFGRTEIDDMKSMDEKLSPEQRKAVIEFLYSQGAEPSDPAHDAALAEQGEAVFKDKCMDCHLYKGEGAEEFDGPDMTGYGSRAWIAKQIADPKSIYGDLNKMTAFAEELSESDIQMLAIYLRLQRFEKPETGALPADLPPPKKKDD